MVKELAAHKPPIREHQHIAPHLHKKHSRYWDAVAVVPTIPMEHDDRRTTGNELQKFKVSASHGIRATPNLVIVLILRGQDSSLGVRN
jgi:hypothetical protein